MFKTTLVVQKFLSDQLIDCRYVKTTHSVVLDYSVNVHQLSEEDQLLGYGELGNFSVAGFEMRLNRYVKTKSKPCSMLKFFSKSKSNIFIEYLFYRVGEGVNIITLAKRETRWD